MSTSAEAIAVITGAAAGQGAATAHKFVQHGYGVVLVDVDPRVEQTAAALGSSAVSVVADIAEEAGWRAVVQRIDATVKAVDVLVNNAGVYRRGSVETMSLFDVDLLYRVNQRAQLLGVRALLPYLKRSRSAAIVNVSSSAGITGDPDIVAYTGTKWAVRGMTKSMAAELAGHSIRVNCVIPGLIDTAMADANGDAVNESILARTFLKRLGAPSEAAAATLFLASEAASYITGAEIVVDGGLSV